MQGGNMYLIAEYDKRYRPYDKSGGELKRAEWVKLPVKPRGEGLAELFEYKRGLEVFGIWCLLLEKATNEKAENRGKLLNHKGQPATIEEIAKGITLKKRIKLVEYALTVLLKMGWIESDNETENISAQSEQCSSKSRVLKSRVEKSKVGKRKFIPPTIEEVIKYVKEKGYNVDVKKFMEYYAESAWHDRDGKPVQNWKQKIIAVWNKPGGQKKCRSLNCKAIGIYTSTDDTGQICWWCEEHKQGWTPAIPKELTENVLKVMPSKNKRSLSDKQNEQKNKLGVR